MTRDDLSDTALVVLNYNTQALTISAINHILALHAGIHIVLVDNASSDGSLGAFKEKFKRNKDVSIIANEKNGGYAKGNNLGLFHAYKIKGVEYVGVINPDVTFEINALKLIVDALKNDLTLGIVTGRSIYNGEKLEPNPCAWKRGDMLRWIFSGTLLGSLLSRMGKCGLSLMRSLRGNYPHEIYDKPIAQVDVVQGSTFFSRASTMKRIGGFDERTFLYYEEDILAEKIKRFGLRNAVVSDAWICHNHIEKDASLKKQSTRLFHLHCEFNSRLLYLREYLDYCQVLKTVLRFYWTVDFRFKNFLVRCIYK